VRRAGSEPARAVGERDVKFFPSNSSATPRRAASGLITSSGTVSTSWMERHLCLASEPYFSVLRDAVLHHIRNNNLRFFKLDAGNYSCNSASHDHHAASYSTEANCAVIELARQAHEASPDLYIMWGPESSLIVFCLGWRFPFLGTESGWKLRAQYATPHVFFWDCCWQSTAIYHPTLKLDLKDGGTTVVGAVREV